MSNFTMYVTHILIKRNLDVLSRLIYNLNNLPTAMEHPAIFSRCNREKMEKKTHMRRGIVVIETLFFQPRASDGDGQVFGILPIVHGMEEHCIFRCVSRRHERNSIPPALKPARCIPGEHATKILHGVRMNLFKRDLAMVNNPADTIEFVSKPDKYIRVRLTHRN
ncbi:hypothetical protein SCLCIDRAFT_278995 [Scleroderma citrinum Foug A]|uniref:Uncharacterized protein n=1 Tax=Scleroderma citrinum Foug A TaxID=1036808 RepID=A0A0C2Z281_9AGAM|nr:hypothetical protein SCLCIDRAFT_278995 [Scleroderma citrinum Foug A]